MLDCLYVDRCIHYDEEAIECELVGSGTLPKRQHAPSDGRACNVTLSISFPEMKLTVSCF